MRTTEAQIDVILNALVARFEAEFPGRVRAYYLMGSYVDGTAVASSDLDVSVVFKDRFQSNAEHTQAGELLGSADYEIEVDLEVTDEAALMGQVDPNFKFSSRLIYGEDIRERLPLLAIEDWTRDRMHTSYWRFVKLFNRPSVVILPLGYPDPADEFYGYIRRAIRLADGSEVLTTRDLIRAVGWAATGLIALKAHRFVANKAELTRVYHEAIGDEWASLIEAIYVRCKLEWNYLIPPQRVDLRDLCGRILGFENHFLSAYHNYVLAELQSGDAVALKQALWVLNEIPLRDDQIIAAQKMAQR